MRSGILTVPQLEDAMNLASQMRVPFGRVLEMHGFCKESDMKKTLSVQTMIGNGDLTLEHGIKAVTLIIKQNLDLETAVRRVTAQIQKSPVQSEKLGQLLKLSGLITDKQLQESTIKCLDTHLPLGSVLVSEGFISPHILECTLTVLELMQENKVTESQATHGIKLAYLNHISMVDALIKQNGPPPFSINSFGLAELLLASGVISEGESLIARELALLQNKPLPEILSKGGFCSDFVTDAAVQLVKLVQEKMLSQEKSIYILRRLKHANRQEEIEDIMSSIDSPQLVQKEVVKLRELLLYFGIVSEKETLAVIPDTLAGNQALVKMLIDNSVLSRESAQFILDIKQLIDTQALTIDQALLVFLYCRENHTSLRNGLYAFGWSKVIAFASNAA